MKKFSFVVVAGGVGTRALPPSPAGDTSIREGGFKQFRDVGGKPMWLWSVLTAAKISEISEIVVVSNLHQNIKSVCEQFSVRDVKIASGGAERADSVRNGLFLCTAPFVMIHDAARPFASETLLRRLMAAVDEKTGAIPLIPVTDALKRVHADGRIEPVERDGLYATQTPQCFPREPLIKVLEIAKNPKDEAEIWELPLVHIEGEKFNFKITFPEDFLIAEAIAKCIGQE